MKTLPLPGQTWRHRRTGELRKVLDVWRSRLAGRWGVRVAWRRVAPAAHDADSSCLSLWRAWERRAELVDDEVPNWVRALDAGYSAPPPTRETFEAAVDAWRARL